MHKGVKPPGREMKICVYCKRAKHLEEFNKEHVLPESFGHFENGLTLIHTVCKECNGYFSGEFELFLARDSLDGIMRYRYGLSKYSSKKKIHHQRLRMKIADHGEWQGALLEFCPPLDQSDAVPDVILLPQIAFFRRNSGDKVHFHINELVSLDRLVRLGLDTSKCFLIANSETDLKKVSEKALELGIDVNKAVNISASQKPRMGEKLKVIMESTIDSTISRAVAKIAFNYLAYVMKEGFALERWFDEIREYIRYGKVRMGRPVKVVPGPILLDGHITSHRTDGHVLTFNWGDVHDLTIVGRVSLFNRLIYKVILCRHYRGLHQELRNAHFFDLRTRIVRPLTR